MYDFMSDQQEFTPNGNSLKIQDKDTVVFLGASVTDCGRNPSGEGSFSSNPYGNGYVNMFISAFRVDHPDWNVRFINKGISGNRSRDMLERLKTDVLEYKPDVVTILAGINDVWRFFDEPAMNTGVGIEEYEQNLYSMVSQILNTAKKCLIMAPYIIDSNKSEPMRDMMDKYGEICKKISEKLNVQFFDTQKIFDDLMKRGISSYEFSGDRIHPTQVGHMAITGELLNVLN